MRTAQLLALAALMVGAECQNYGAIGAAHRDAEVFTSSGGTLSTSLAIDAFRYNGPTAQFWGRAYNGGFPGPTFRIKRGDTWTLNFVNALGPNPTVQQQHNTYKDPNTTNVHTHGLHISGESPGDNVLRVVEPGESTVYEYVMPDDHAGGTFWYHPHHHGSTALQAGGGAAGMIIVEDTAGDLPDVIANAPEVLVMAQYFAINTNPSLDTLATEALDEVTVQDFVGDSDFVLINGLYQPVISMDSGKWYRFRIVHSGTIALLGVSAIGCETELIAKDGIYLPTAPRQITTAYIVAGGRADIMIRCPVGSFSFESGAGAGGPGGRPGPPGPGAEFSGVLATLSVTEVPGQAADPALSSFQARKPNYLSDLTGNGVAIDGFFGLAFGGGGGGCRINGASWESETNFINSQAVGGVYEWDVTGVQGHPFHLHVNSYQITSVTDATGYLQVGDWHDTLYHPNGNGAITVRYQTDRFTGKAMMHCHFLPHEDRGCMAIAEITGTEGTPGRIAEGFGGGFPTGVPPVVTPIASPPPPPSPSPPPPPSPPPSPVASVTPVTYNCRQRPARGQSWSEEQRMWCCTNRPEQVARARQSCPRQLLAPTPQGSTDGNESSTAMRVPSPGCDDGSLSLQTLTVASLVANLIAVIVIVCIIICRGRTRAEPEQDKWASCFPWPAIAVPEVETVPTRAETGTQPQGKYARKSEVTVELQEAVTPPAEDCSPKPSPGPSPSVSPAGSPRALFRKKTSLPGEPDC